MTVAQTRQQTTVGRSRAMYSYDNLLPGPAAVLEHVGHCLAKAGSATHALVLIALLRRTDGWPLPASTLSTVTAALTRSIRADDWIGRSGISDLAVVIRGTTAAAATMADRLVHIIDDLRLPGVTACAAVLGLAPGLDAVTAMGDTAALLRTARDAGILGVVTR